MDPRPNEAHPLLADDNALDLATVSQGVPSRKKKSFAFIYLMVALVLALGIGAGAAFLPQDVTRIADEGSRPQQGEVMAAETTVQQNYFWKPNIASISANPKLAKPQLSAKNALAMDLDSGEVYFVKDVERPVPMASITKIMTALLTKENAQDTDLYQVSDFAANVGENTMGAQVGEKYTVNELLWGLFLHSGNDAAETLAENIGKSRQNFVAMMNHRAKELGMQHTVYINPSGMEENHNMRTTALDLAILSKFTLDKYPELLDITKTIEKTIPANQYHKKIDLVGEIDLIRTYPGAVGFKTGFTDEAGRCIITVAENQGKRMMVIVLGSQDRRVDAVKLLDYAYANEGITIKHEPYW